MPVPLRAWIDAPTPHQEVYGESISISGWLHAEATAPVCVRAYLDQILIGETRRLFLRPDVSEHLGFSHEIPTGFRLLARVPGNLDSARDSVLTVRASFEDPSREKEIGEVVVRLVPAHLSLRDHGRVLFPEQRTLLHREQIYGSGPPMDEPGVECLRTILDYLPARASVLDVGCGSGAYGPAILASGRSWLGLEQNDFCQQRLRERNLPHRAVPVASAQRTAVFPCADQEFDCSICIEVLEHIALPDEFLREIARSTRQRLLVSVPNMEIVPYFKPWEVVPWHLLEADHKNFFTRSSLRALLSRHFENVEVFSYVDHPLRTRDGIPVHVHLFAVAESQRG